MNRIIKKIYRFVRYVIIQRNVYGLTSFMRVSPDFFVAGVVRSGTTSLYHNLDKHPSIVKSAYDELGFFDSNFQLGWMWYRSLFPTNIQKRKVEKESGKFLTFDDTPFYIYNSVVAKRIKKFFPETKIIVVLRNPIDRAYSNYFLGVKSGNEKRTFEDIVEEEIDLVNKRNKKLLFDETLSETHLGRGLYSDQLKIWFELFDRNRIKIIKSEEFSQKPEKIMNEIFEFLEIKECNIDDFEKKNVAKYPPMKKETRKKLVKFFEPFNDELYNMLNVNFEWK